MRAGEESERTPALLWLLERRLFHFIYNIQVFIKFRYIIFLIRERGSILELNFPLHRKWKAFQVWKGNVKRATHGTSKFVLHKILFCANEILQGCLLHVRSLCERASGSLTGYGVGENAIVLLDLKRKDCITLGEFISHQRVQGDIALKQLKAIENSVTDLVFEACAVSTARIFFINLYIFSPKKGCC